MNSAKSTGDADGAPPGERLVLHHRRRSTGLRRITKRTRPIFGFDVLVEKLGLEILLYMAVAQHTMVASVEPNLRVAAHKKLRLAMNPARLHFFDASSEAVI